MTQAISSSNLPPSPSFLSDHPDVKSVMDHIFAFSPNRDTLGGTAYLILEEGGNILIDAPPWSETIQELLTQCGGIQWLAFTHRGAMGNPSNIQHIKDSFQCDVLVQEQEAYLLPDLDVITFQDTVQLSPTTQMFWTPGHTPGSSCLYHHITEGKHATPGVLFTGRHLLPNTQGQIQPLRVAKTFHWFRQLNSIQHLKDSFTADSLEICCPGANTGFLRGKRYVPDLYNQLMTLDLDALKAASPGM